MVLILLQSARNYYDNHHSSLPSPQQQQSNDTNQQLLLSIYASTLLNIAMCQIQLPKKSNKYFHVNNELESIHMMCDTNILFEYSPIQLCDESLRCVNDIIGYLRKAQILEIEKRFVCYMLHIIDMYVRYQEAIDTLHVVLQKILLGELSHIVTSYVLDYGSNAKFFQSYIANFSIEMPFMCNDQTLLKTILLENIENKIAFIQRKL